MYKFNQLGETISNLPMEGPFAFRAHHISDLLFMQKDAMEQYGKFLLELLPEERKAVIEAHANNYIEALLTKEFERSYVEDVIGPYARNRITQRLAIDKYKPRLYSGINAMVNYEGDRIIGNVKDGICNACLVGKHCEMEIEADSLVIHSDLAFIYRINEIFESAIELKDTVLQRFYSDKKYLLAIEIPNETFWDFIERFTIMLMKDEKNSPYGAISFSDMIFEYTESSGYRYGKSLYEGLGLTLIEEI